MRTAVEYGLGICDAAVQRVAISRPHQQIWRSMVKSISPVKMLLDPSLQSRRLNELTDVIICLDFLQRSIMLLIREFTKFNERAPELH